MGDKKPCSGCTGCSCNLEAKVDPPSEMDIRRAILKLENERRFLARERGGSAYRANRVLQKAVNFVLSIYDSKIEGLQSYLKSMKEPGKK